MKLPSNTKQYLTLLILILFSFAFNSCIEDIFGPERDDPIDFNYEMWAVRSDGSDSTKIADGGRLCAFLPEANKILYLSSPYQTIGLNTINLDGTGQSFLWKDDYWDINKFSYSPDNSKILLPTDYNGLYELDSRSLRLKQILKSNYHTTPQGNVGYNPVGSACYSKSMTRIVYQDNSGITIIGSSVNSPIIDKPVTIRKSSDSLEVKSPGFIFNDTQVIYLERTKTWPPSDLYSLRSYSLKTGSDSELINPNSIPLYGEHFEVIDENRIICLVRENNKYFVKIIDLADNFRTVALGEGQNFSLSPGRSKVIIYDDKSFYSINPDGTDRRLIYTETGDKVKLTMASLSFDGRYIVFGRSIDVRH
ncbi:MAG: hypothetical protein ACM3QX_12320 [Syntrophomonadaceae bacterium]